MKITKLISGVCIVALAAGSFSSCGNSGKEDVTYIPFRSDEDGKWGMISTDGKILFENEFHNVPTYVTDNRFFVQNQDGFWEMYSASEKPERIGGELRYATSFSNGVAMVTPRNGAISIIDRDGEVKVQLKQIEGKNITQAGGFVGKIAPVQCDTLFGAVNTKGETILPPDYRDMKITQKGRVIASDYAYVSTHYFYDSIPPRGKQIIFNEDGKQLYALDVKKHFAVVPEGVTDRYITVCDRKITMKTDGYGNERYTYPELKWTYSIIDYEGNTVVAPSKSVSAILAVSGDLYIYLNEDNLAGVKRIDGTDVIKPEYNGINFIGTNYIATEKSGVEDDVYKSTFKLYDLAGKQITHDVYSGIAGNNTYRAIAGNNVFVCSDGDEWELVGEKGIKKEEMPKIYAMVPYSYGDDYVVSDEIDFARFFKKMNITANSMGGFTFATAPQQAILLQQKSWGMYDDIIQSKPKPSDYTYMTSVCLYSVEDGHSYSSEVQYPSVLSRQTFTQRKVIDYTYGNYYWYHMQKVPTGYTFNDITPSWFKITFSNYAYYGHLRKLYKELAKYVKPWGTIEESNPGATFMTLNNGRQLIVALTENEVFIKWGKLPAEDKWIGQYSSNTEKLESNYQGNPYMINLTNCYGTSFGCEEEGDI